VLRAGLSAGALLGVWGWCLGSFKSLCGFVVSFLGISAKKKPAV